MSGRAGSGSAAAPPMFWHLPAGARGAVYEYVPEARRFEAIRHTAAELVDGYLQHEGIAPADRAPLISLFAEKFLIDTPVVAAVGAFSSSGPAKAAGKSAEKGGKEPPQGAERAPLRPVQT